MTNLGLALNNSKGTLEVGAAEVHGKGAKRDAVSHETMWKEKKQTPTTLR